MQNLPSAEVYEKEFRYMPWGTLIHDVEDYVIKNAPQNAKLLDVLCGPGYLLGKLKEMRQDLVCHGVDLESEFINYAKQKYPTITFEVADAFSFDTSNLYDVVLVTAGLHHLPFEQQEKFIEKVSGWVKPEGFVIIGDPYIDDYTNESERKIGGARLGYEYLVATIKNGGTQDVIDAAIQVLINDVKLVEWKSSIVKNTPMFKKYFSHVEMYKTWPKDETGYGDYYFILRK